MARSLRQSSFRRRSEVGEDVNPSAYIVNLADCMLVLACGFMVALIAYWNVDIQTSQQVDESDMKQVAPDTIPEDVEAGGTGYVEAGKVYRDSATGELYMVETDGDSSSDGGQAGSSGSSSASSASGSGSSSSASSTSSTASSASSSSNGSNSSSKSGGSTAGSASSKSISDARAGGAD